MNQPASDSATRKKELQEAISSIKRRYKEQKALLEWAEDDFEVSLIEEELTRLRGQLAKAKEEAETLSDRT